MSFETLGFLEVFQRPNVDLVFLKTVARDYFVSLFGKQNVADLTLCLVLHHLLSFAYVPDSYFLVGGSCAAGQDVRVVRRPRDCLYCGLVGFLYDRVIRF